MGKAGPGGLEAREHAPLCELCKVAQRSVHRWDRSADQTTVADTALEFESFKLEANRLFSVRSVQFQICGWRPSAALSPLSRFHIWHAATASCKLQSLAAGGFLSC